MSDEQTTNVPQSEPITVNVDANTAFTLKLQEFDKAIATAEAQAANLKMQRATYLYETNLNSVVAQSKALEEAGVSEAQVVPQA